MDTIQLLKEEYYRAIEDLDFAIEKNKEYEAAFGHLPKDSLEMQDSFDLNNSRNLVYTLNNYIKEIDDVFIKIKNGENAEFEIDDILDTSSDEE